MQTQSVKETARDLVDELPDDASWRDLIFRIVLRASIEQGLSEADAGLLTSQAEIEREFGFDS